MTVKHENFYENLEEATIRLHKTVVMYDGRPYYVRALTDHKGDKAFRAYIEPLTVATGRPGYGVRSDHPHYGFYQLCDSYNNQGGQLGTALDTWLETNKKATILRKKLNSPLFDKFRPFPLGMVNTGEQLNGRCFYIERQPKRQREQGLTGNMCLETMVTCGRRDLPMGEGGLHNVSMFSQGFEDMILGNYPSARECYDAMLDSEVTNEALAFHRLFAFCRGPLDTIFLAYKDEIVGMVKQDFGAGIRVELGQKFRHLKEAAEATGAFNGVR